MVIMSTSREIVRQILKDYSPEFDNCICISCDDTREDTFCIALITAFHMIGIEINEEQNVDV